MLGKIPDNTAWLSIGHSRPDLTAAAPGRIREREFCILLSIGRCGQGVFRVRFRRMFPVSDTERAAKMSPSWTEQS